MIDNTPQIKIAEAFLHLPFTPLGQGISDELLAAYDDDVDEDWFDCPDTNGGSPQVKQESDLEPEPATSSVSPSPEPDRRNLAVFVLTLFKYATPGNWVSLRAFPDKKGHSKPFRIAPIKLNGNLDDLIDQAYLLAEYVAHVPEKVVFCPPVATFTNAQHAGEKDLAEGLVLSIECDAHPRAALAKLIALLGLPTVMVESGGQWTDPETGETEPKLHIYYRLKAPTRSKEEHQKLKLARKLATGIVGGDASNITVVHPIRWPGSLHRKRDPKPCRIVSPLNPDADIDLDSALESLQRAAGDVASSSNGKGAGNGAQQPIAEKFKGLDPQQSLGQGIEFPEYPPLPFEPDIKAGCGWLRHVHDTGGADQSEILWRDSLRVSMFLVDGKTLIHKFSKEYPGYTHEETEAKFERARKDKEDNDLGYPKCQTICDHGSTHCKSCPHLAEGKSPLNLALPQPPPAEPVPPTEPVNKLPWMVELGSKLWGTAKLYGKEYRFGEDQSKVLDPIKGMWFDFTNNKGGTLRDLIKIAETQTTPSANLPFPYINMSNWDHEPVPDQQWVVLGRIPHRQSVIFSGEGGAGKSMIQLHLSAATVLGRDWLGAIPKQGPALFIDCEDDQDVLHYRLAAVAQHYGVSFTDLIKGGLHLSSLVGQDTVLATASRSGVIEPTPLYSRLLQMAGDIKPNIIGIAATATVFAGDENNRSQVQQFINLTTRLAVTANGSVVLISHPSLTGISTGTGLSGTTQWHNAVRGRLFLKSPKTEPGEIPNSDLREIEFKKNQYGAMPESIPLRWQDGMFLPIAGATFDRAGRMARAIEVFLDLLQRFTTENRYVSSNPGSTYAPAVFAKEDKAKEASVNKIALTIAMRHLFACGKIHNENHGKSAQPRYHIAIKP